MMGTNVYVLSQNHRFDRTDIPMRKQGFSPAQPIIIDDDVWIGNNVNISAFAEDSKSYLYAIQNKPTYLLLLFLAYYFFTGGIEGNVTYLLSYIGVYLMIFSGHVQFLYYYRRNRLKEIKFIVYLSLIGWMIISILALSFYSRFPGAARTLAAYGSSPS